MIKLITIAQLKKAFYRQLKSSLEKIEFTGCELNEWQKCTLCANFMALGYLTGEEKLYLNISSVRQCNEAEYESYLPNRAQLERKNIYFYEKHWLGSTSHEFTRCSVAGCVPLDESKSFITQFILWPQFLPQLLDYEINQWKKEEELITNFLATLCSIIDINHDSSYFFDKSRIGPLVELMSLGNAPSKEEVLGAAAWLTITENKVALEQKIKSSSRDNTASHKI